MIGLEGIIRELFFREHAWRKVLIGGALCYLLLGFGYLRNLARLASQSAEVELPAFTSDKKFFRLMFSALPVGVFYAGLPLFLAYGVVNLLRLMSLGFLDPIFWGLGAVCSLTMVSVAFVTVPEDPERFFLGLEFEKVVAQWWKLKRVWAFPALASYGLMAVLGVVFYGLTFFVCAAVMVTYLSLSVRNARFA